MFHAIFHDRHDAGKQLASHINQQSFTDPILLALPRGGVVIADEIAATLKLPLHVVVTRKIGAPSQPEYGIGAISENSSAYFNPEVKDYYDSNSEEVQEIVRTEEIELGRRIDLYRKGEKLPLMKGKTLLVIDDGLATGVTAIAAAKYLRTLYPKEIILVVPVAPKDVGEEVKRTYDRIICLHEITNLRSIGQWYDDFSQVEDDEVLTILGKYH